MTWGLWANWEHKKCIKTNTALSKGIGLEFWVELNLGEF